MASRFLKEDRGFSFATSAPRRECRAMWRRDHRTVASTPALSDHAQKLATIYAGSPYQSKRLYKLPEGRVGTTAYQPIIGGHKW
jgi:hypothetical protein